MSNYTNENLINVPSNKVPAGTLAMKVGDNIFTAGSLIPGGPGASIIKLEVTPSMSQSDIRALFASIPQDMGGKLYAVKFAPATYNFSDSLTISKDNGRLLLYSQKSDSRASIVITGGQAILLSSSPTVAFQLRNLNVTSQMLEAGPSLICKSCNFVSNQNDSASARYVLGFARPDTGAFIRNPVIVLQDCNLSCTEGSSTSDRGFADTWFSNGTILVKNIKWNPYNTSNQQFITSFGAYSGIVLFYNNVTSDTVYSAVTQSHGSLGNYVVLYDASTSHQGYSTTLDFSNYFTDLAQL